MRLAAVALLALALAAPLVAAQTQVNPVVGQYGDSYYVAGRIVDPSGRPVVGADLVVEVEQRGVEAKPFRSTTSCFGDFIFTFNFGDVDRTGRVRVTLVGAAAGVPDQTVEARLDPFLRRSDLRMQSAAAWPQECSETALWPGRITAVGRIVNRTEPYEGPDGVLLDARPYSGYIRLRLHSTDGRVDCPPSQRGSDVCDLLPVDERGDFRYSFIFPDGKPAEGKLEVVVGDQHHNVTVDPLTRMGVFHIELSGQGAPERRDSPAPGLGLVLATVALALLSRNVRNRPPR